MNISEANNISQFLNKLDNFPLNKVNKVEIIEFIDNLKLKLSVDFGTNHYLKKKISQISFTAKPYFAEMKDLEQEKSWSLGILQLKNCLSEIIEKCKNVMDLSDISTLEIVITSGVETNLLEFKSTLRWDLKLQKINEALEKVVLKTVCALNNFKGGNLFIGVADNGDILGLNNDYQTFENGFGNRDKFELHMRNIFNNYFSKSFVAKNIQIKFPKPQGVEICQVKVEKGDNPLFLKVGNSKGQDVKERFYIRNGNQSVELEKVTEIVDYSIARFGQKIKNEDSNV
jgi:hypothetical protein